jgi:Lrp/AsnC family transcriptional regulator, leucine-responsive regulatory protein
MLREVLTSWHVRNIGAQLTRRELRSVERRLLFFIKGVDLPLKTRNPVSQSKPAAKFTDSGAPEPGAELDRIDRRILALLQEDGRLTNVRLADLVGLSPSPCLRRVKRLESEGYINGYSAILDVEKVGFGATVFVHVSITQSTSTAADEFRKAVSKIREVVACHAVSGNDDFLLTVITRDLESYKQVNQEILLRLPNVVKKVSSFSLDLIKQVNRLPLEILPAFKNDLVNLPTVAN